MTSIEWAAWVQAVGSVLAIFTAIGIGARANHQARELVFSERHRQAFIVAHSLSYRFHMLAEQARIKMVGLQARLREFPDSGTLFVPEEKVRNDCIIEGSDQIDPSMLLLLDKELGAMAATALDALDVHNQIVNDRLTGLNQASADVSDVASFYGGCIDSASQVENLLRRAQQNLEDYFDVPRLTARRRS